MPKSYVQCSPLTLLLFSLWAIASHMQTAEAQIITSFDPGLGSPGERIIISGSGFSGRSVKVFFNGVQDTTAQLTSVSTIYARVPQGATTGPITVQVDASSVSSIQDFLVVGLGPFIVGFSPEFGAVNDQVIIYGWHLTNASAVKFAGTNATSFLPNASGSQITTHVPSKATNGPITVTTTYGTSNSPSAFTVIGPGPYIADFDPPAGNAGTTVYIDGAHFSSATSATFDGKPGVNFFVQSDTRIKVSAPAGVTTGFIAVNSSLGKFTNTADYFYVPPAITGFTPFKGRAGTNVLISGSNFLGANAVTIGNIPADFIDPTNNTNLVVTAPAGAPSGPIRVFTPAASVFTATNFQFLPTVFGFIPAFGPAGTKVVLSGANLNEGTPTIKFGTVTAALAGVSFGQVTCTVPVAAVSGPISITTTNGTFTSATNFFLPPVITRISTNIAPVGSVISIFGSNLLGTTTVTFNGLPASFVPAATNTLVQATVPVGVTTGPVSVTTPAGTATASNIFYAPPRIDSFTPPSGVPGTVVTITGASFTDATAVKFNGVAGEIVSVSTNGTIITATAPADLTSGPISVTAPAGTATSAQSFLVAYSNDVAITSASAPSQVFVGSNFVYQLTITNHGPSVAANVKFLDVLPPSVSLMSNFISQGALTFNGLNVSSTIATLPTNHAVNIALTVRPGSVGIIQNTASVTSDYPDPTMSNNSIFNLTTVLPLPVLSIHPYSDTQWKISWPAMLTNYALQFNTTLASTPWSNHLSAPLFEGTNKFVIEPAFDPRKFYRLKY